MKRRKSQFERGVDMSVEMHFSRHADTPLLPPRRSRGALPREADQKEVKSAVEQSVALLRVAGFQAQSMHPDSVCQRIESVGRPICLCWK